MIAFCPACGTKTTLRTPEGDNRERAVCTACGRIHYENPRVVVGSVAWAGDRVLLCRRAIDPRLGFWTLPAGFLELGEHAEEGARREAMEEATATLRLRGLLAVYSLPHISQVQLFFLADLDEEAGIAAGPESLEVGLFTLDAVPWGDLAFPTVAWALQHAEKVRREAVLVPDVRTR